MPEVERGFLMAGHRHHAQRRPLEQGPDVAFFQGGSHGLVFRGLRAGTPIRLVGMHPTRPRIAFELPPPPRIELQSEGKRKRVMSNLHHVVCRPADEQVCLVYGAAMPATRTLLPGVHESIPLALVVDGDAPLVYDTPLSTPDRAARG